MITFLFLLLSTTNISQAQECNSLSGLPMNDGLSTVLELADPISLEHWTATADQVANAPCRQLTPPLLVDVNSYLSSYTGNQHRTIGGARFKNQSEQKLEALRHLINGADISSIMEVEPKCEEVQCAVERVWGEELGPKLLYMKLKHGYNGSEFAFPNTARMRPREIDELLVSLSDLPAHLSRIGKRGNQQFTTAAEGVRHPTTPEAYADAAIMLYNKWRDDIGVSPYLTHYSLFHEYAHNIGDLFDDVDETSAWQSMAACQVSNYGNSNQVEDFAETVAMYRYNAAGLQTNCPDKYNYLRNNIFRGIEYLSEATCNRDPLPESDD